MPWTVWIKKNDLSVREYELYDWGYEAGKLRGFGMLYDLKTIARWVEQLKDAVEAAEVSAAAKAAKQLSSRRVALELTGIDPAFIARV